MRYAIIALGCGLAVAGCQNEPEINARNATVEEVANQVAEVSSDEQGFIRPGQWASTMTIEELTAPGLPAGMTDRVKTMMGDAQTSESCLTEAETKKPKEEFFAGKGNECRYDHFKMGDGKIDAKMRCTQSGVSQVMEMAGSYSPDNYQMRMKTNVEGGGPQGGMTMQMKVDAKRIGECTKKTA